MPVVKIQVEGTYTAKGGGTSGGFGGGGGRGGGGGGFAPPRPYSPEYAALKRKGTPTAVQKPQQNFFKKLEGAFTQPLYDLLRVMGIGFKNIAGLRLGVRMGSKMSGGGGGGGGAGFMAKGGGTTTKAVGGGGGGMGGMAAAAPLMAIAAGIAIIVLFLKKIMDNSEAVKAIMTIFNAVFGTIGDMIFMSLFMILDHFDILNKVVDALKTDFGELYSYFKDGDLEGLMNRVFEIVSDAAKDVYDTLITKLKNYLADKWENLKAYLLDKWEGIKTAIKDKIGELVQSVKDKWDSIDWKALKDDIKDGVKKGITDAMDELPGKIASAIKEKVGDAVDFYMDVTGISTAFDVGKKFFNYMEDWSFPGIDDLTSFEFPWIGKLSDFTFPSLDTLTSLDFSGFTDIFSLDFGGFTKLFDLDFSDATKFIEKLTGGILGGDGASGIKDTAGKFISGVFD